MRTHASSSFARVEDTEQLGEELLGLLHLPTLQRFGRRRAATEVAILEDMINCLPSGGAYDAQKLYAIECRARGETAKVPSSASDAASDSEISSGDENVAARSALQQFELLQLQVDELELQLDATQRFQAYDDTDITTCTNNGAESSADSAFASVCPPVRFYRLAAEAAILRTDTGKDGDAESALDRSNEAISSITQVDATQRLTAQLGKRGDGAGCAFIFGLTRAAIRDNVTAAAEKK